MPRRIITAYWIISFGYLKAIVWGFAFWMYFDDSRNSLAESWGLLVFSVLTTTVYLVAMVVAGNWMKSANPKGHYLAAVALAFPVLFVLSRGINGEVLMALGFLALIVADIRKLRSDPEFSLTVDGYRLAEFWPMPWLVTALCIAAFGHGAGAVPAGIVHLVSPLPVGYIIIKLHKHPAIQRTPQPGRFYWSLSVWAMFYVASIFLGTKILGGLSGLAMQGAGQ